jgi:membrane protease YdiL (CAAX protease family)
VALLYFAMAGMNWVFGLGQAVDAKEFIAQSAGGQAAPLEMVPTWVLLLSTGLQSVVLAPFIALVIVFGEEYGWRGFLQRRLIRLGKLRGVLLVGVIWGVWHAPVIAMGHNYPGYPVVGIFLMTLYTIAMAVILGLAVLKAHGIWIAAFLHGLNNQVYSFLVLLVYRPDDPVFSFGVGIYGIAILFVVAGLLLFDREWRTPASFDQLEP